MAKAKAQRITSPRGTFAYPYLTKPDTKFNAEGEYKVNLTMKTEDAADMIALLEKALEGSVAKAKEENKGKKIKTADLPISYNEDESEVTFKFKLKAQGTKKDGEVFTQQPAIFDAKGKPMVADKATSIGSGTVGKVAFEIVPFFTALVGAGVSLRLKAVQVIELVRYGSGGDGSAFGFGNEGGDDDEDDADSTEGFTNEEDGAEEDADF